MRPARPAEYANPDIFLLSDGAGNNRYPPQAGRDAADVGSALSAAEVQGLLTQAFGVMTAARAAIRQPLDSRAQVTITVTDTYGTILGLVRAPDTPLFGIDVALQKDRSAAFLSNARAASDLAAAGRDPALGGSGGDVAVSTFVGRFRSALGDSNALNGSTAFAVRSLGNLARPLFPDGQDGTVNGPLSHPIGQWSVFATGLQSSLIRENVVHHVGYVAGTVPTDAPSRCTFLPEATPGTNRLQNGLQIFPGGVPIYRGSRLVGALGVSGDGVIRTI